MLFEELINNPCPIKDTYSSLKVVLPSQSFRIRIRPQEIAQESIISVANRSFDLVDIFQILEKRAEPSMNAKDAICDDSSDRQILKGIGYNLKQLYAKFLFTLIIESIYFVQVAALMVTSKQKKIKWMLDFQRHQKAVRLKRFFSSVYIITQEKITAFRRISNSFENRDQVRELSMSISANNNWRMQLQQHWLGHYYGLEAVAECLYFITGNWKASLVGLWISCFQSLDDLIDIQCLLVFLVHIFFYLQNRNLSVILGFSNMPIQMLLMSAFFTRLRKMIDEELYDRQDKESFIL